MEYGLIGEKLGHSYSKIIQEQLLDDYTYEINPVAPESLDAFMRAKAFKAINVTIPYKQKVIPYLDEMDELSKKIGAVNTIVNKDGKLIGHNTDYLGFAYMLKKHGVKVENKKVLILGNGGASQAVQAVIKDLNPSHLYITDLNRTAGILGIDEIYDNPDIQIVINTTPLGMYPGVNRSAVDLARLSNLETVIDVVYNPLHTTIIMQAKDMGLNAFSGLEMLVAQAKYALEFFKDIQLDDNKIDEIYHSILQETTNVIWIGTDAERMREASKLINKGFISIRAEIVKASGGVALEDYRNHIGDKAFHELEDDIIANLCIMNNVAIAACDACIAHPDNLTNLKRNALLIPINDLSAEALATTYKEAIKTY